MVYNYNKKLVPTAQALRRSMTPEERHLWYDFLKRLPLTVHRQKNVGNYIVDFLIAQAGVVIEVDGRQHRLPQHEAADKNRDFELGQLGLQVLRYTNEDIRMNFQAVCEDILKHLGLQVDDLQFGGR